MRVQLKIDDGKEGKLTFDEASSLVKEISLCCLPAFPNRPRRVRERHC